MIEAFSVGTPVIAFGNGSVPEVVDEGITGFVVDNVAEAAKAVDRVGGLDRTGVRHVFEERFSAKRMTDDYLALYDALQTQEPLRLLKRAS
jgi:glycosyltransferase involved in cell wall biosynthesis